LHSINPRELPFALFISREVITDKHHRGLMILAIKYEYITSRWKASIETKGLLVDYGPTEAAFSVKFGNSITIQHFIFKWLLFT